MIPNATMGTFNQKVWRGAGDTDDCVVLETMQSVAAVAGWEKLYSVPDFRAAAGNPDDTTVPDGLTIDQQLVGIRKLWPKLGAFCRANKGTGTWADATALLKAGHPLGVRVYSASIASRDGAPVRHDSMAYWNGSIIRLVNPLRAPHSIGLEISEATLKAAMDQYPEAGYWYMVWPTPEQAFTTHPLYQAPGGITPEELEAAVLAARRAQYDVDLAAANAAPIALGPRP